MCHFKRKIGGIYCFQHKWESKNLYNIPHIVSGCYPIAAICRWNGTDFKRRENLKGFAERKTLDHWFNYFKWKLDSMYECLKIYAGNLRPKYVGVSFMKSIIYKDLYIKVYLVAFRLNVWKFSWNIFNPIMSKNEISIHLYCLYQIRAQNLKYNRIFLSLDWIMEICFPLVFLPTKIILQKYTHTHRDMCIYTHTQ